jgi:hypothetical protein
MALSITINLTDAEENVLKNDLLDVESWIQTAVTNKLASAKKRMVREWFQRLKDDPAVTTVPADDDEIVDVILARPDYEDRVTREPVSQ